MLQEFTITVRDILVRILATRRPGLRADNAPAINWDGTYPSNRRSDERRAVEGRRHDDIQPSPERRKSMN